MGGGLWTATAIPLLATVGPPVVFFISLGAVAVWLTAVFVARSRARA
jgi:hypothetical protein